MFGPVCLEGLLQPARVGHANHRIVFQFGQQCFTFALGAAQHGIEEPLAQGFFSLSTQPTVSPMAAWAGIRVCSS